MLSHQWIPKLWGQKKVYGAPSHILAQKGGFAHQVNLRQGYSLPTTILGISTAIYVHKLWTLHVKSCVQSYMCIYDKVNE